VPTGPEVWFSGHKSRIFCTGIKKSQQNCGFLSAPMYCPEHHRFADKRDYKTMAKAPAAAKVETVTLKHIAAMLAESHEIPKKQSIALLEDLVATIAKHLKKGARIRIGGLGVLQVRKRPARMGRNPATGEAIKIKASKKIAFRAAKELKESI
jgi:DNA-binding protein HU-beta